MAEKHSKPNPLPMSETLRDLAMLRVSEIDFSSLLPSDENTMDTSSQTDQDKKVDDIVEKSFEFVKEARAAIKIQNRGDVEKEGAKVEVVRSRLEDVIIGLDTAKEN
ncbi:hypothetical protein ABKN59_002402 [Abortiporus biennis]